MLPPVPAETLAANPRFAALYELLTTKLLDPADAGSREKHAEHHAIDQDLRTHRAELAKARLLRDELAALTSRTTALSEELQEALDLLTSPFYRSLGKDSQLLLADEAEAVADALPELGAAVSSSLQKAAREVAGVAYAGESATSRSRLDSLPGDTAHRLHALQRAHLSLSSLQHAQTALFVSLLETHRATTAQLLNVLHTQQASVAPALATKATHLALVAESLALKLQTLRGKALASIYDPEALAAMQEYRLHLTDTVTRLRARERVVQGQLEKFESLGSDMGRIVERYAGLCRRVEAVRADVRRLIAEGA